MEFGVRCTGIPGGRCPSGTTEISLKQLRILVRDEAIPTFASAPGGTIASTSRIRTVTYAATDAGGGIYRHRLLADGVEVAGGPVDENAGKCVRHSEGGFAAPVPCKASVSGSLSFDTSQLTDGSHRIELQVLDATDVNKAVESWTVTVDNAPPVVGDVSVSGVAREGEMLRCEATVDGQSAQVARQWVRSAADGSDAVAIQGATAADYTVSGADVGRKLACRVTASDGGGTTTMTSALSSGPFAGGVVVAPKNGGTTGGGGAASGAGGAAATGGGRSGAAASGGPPALPALPACTSATVAMNAPAQLTRAYGRSALALPGRLVATAGGQPVAGAEITVMQTVTRAGVSRRTKVAATRTASDGSFTARIPRGPTRKLQLVETGCGAVGMVVSQRVRGSIRARALTPRVRNRQLARFSGRVSGGHFGRGLPLELQVKVGRTWRDVKAMTSNSRGEFRVSYRFMRTLVRYTYRFRVVTRGGSAWPYMPARSREIRVRVN